MSDWQERKGKSKREIESGKFLRELLNSPTVQSKMAFVAQYNPNHYILFSDSSLGEGESYGLSQ
jgi:hypothetical protein